MDKERHATRRTSYLARTTELRRTEAKAVAWSELGYSSGGIAKQIDSSEGTVSTYLDRAAARYGLEIAHANDPGDDNPDYEQVGPEYLDELSDAVAKQWLRIVDKQRGGLPQEWVNSVEQEAEKRGLPFHRL